MSNSDLRFWLCLVVAFATVMTFVVIGASMDMEHKERMALIGRMSPEDAKAALEAGK